MSIVKRAATHMQDTTIKGRISKCSSSSGIVVVEVVGGVVV